MNNPKLILLREAMQKSNIDAYIIPINDPHLGEYVPSHWRIIEWLTGFTGSAANVVLTKNFAGLWTDSRYFIQAENELKNSNFSLMKLKVPHTLEYIDWLAENLKEKPTIALDGRIIPIGTIRQINKRLKRQNASIKLDKDLVSELWTNRTPMPQAVGFEHELKYADESRESKIARVRTNMKEYSADFHLITSLDDIAWLLNIRGSDVNYSPLLTSYALLSTDTFRLFIDNEKLPSDLKEKLLNVGIEFKKYDDINASLSKLSESKSILLTPGTTSALLHDSIPHKMEIIEDVSIPTRLKAIKNHTEIAHIKNTMVKDGVALTKFFFWLETNIGQETITEISAADKLLSLRMEQENCIGPSFATIAGYNEHGASPHYCANPESDVELKPEGIFLLDSGGQYLDGTTDVTRTICLGKPTKQQKKDFTLALKGTISLAMAKFPYGTKGFQLDILARKALWDKGLNYGHGTGHGVGFFLNVHEGPQSIGTGASGNMKTILEPGMLTADEPAIYRIGEYGFRTENLILCVDDMKNNFGRFLKFETVTLAYIDSSLIEKKMLSDEEINWLNNYHLTVYDKLSPQLNIEEREWLRGKIEKV